MLPIYALSERRPLSGSNLRQQRSVCHILDLTRALVMKTQHQTPCMSSLPNDSDHPVLSQAHFSNTLKGLKKVQGIFHENPECNQLPQLNQNQKKKSDGFI